MSPWLVVSDLDHTILASPSDVDEAGRAIRELGDQGITSTLASSKTFSEMICFYDDAGLVPSPFIFENGCGIGWPLADLPPALNTKVALRQQGFGAILLGSALTSAGEILLERRMREGFNFSLMEELDPSDLTRLTGLDSEAARRALNRLASVPILWRDSPERLQSLVDDLSLHGLIMVSGGTFRHVSPPCDKYSALLKILEWQNAYRDQMKFLACGDSENDVTLLKNAEVALLFSAQPDSPLIPHIQSPHDAMNPMSGHTARRPLTLIEGAGPSVWLSAVSAALKCQNWVSPHE